MSEIIFPINEEEYKRDCQMMYQQGRADAIEELKPSADVVAYEQGRLDALDYCEKCETDQWDALYKMEVQGKIKGIDECIKAIEESKSLFDNHHHSTMAEKDRMINLLKGLKEQKMTLIDYDKLKYEFDEKCVGDCGCCDESNCPVFNQTEISLEEHDAKVRADAIKEFAKEISKLSKRRYMHDIYQEDIEEIKERLMNN